MIEVSPEDFNVMKIAIIRYGVKAQLRQLQEECAELIVSINHCARGRDGAADEFLEEFIDVYILMCQLFIASDAQLDFYMMFDEKMSRLKEYLSIK